MDKGFIKKAGELVMNGVSLPFNILGHMFAWILELLFYLARIGKKNDAVSGKEEKKSENNKVRMEYCWVDNRKAYYELKNAFEVADIEYELSTEWLITKNNKFAGTKIWLFHFASSSRGKVDKLIEEHNDIISTEPCVSQYVKVSDKLPSGFKKIYYVNYIIMTLLFVMTIVSGYLGYYSWVRPLFFLSIISILLFAKNHSKRHPLGIWLFMAYESFFIIMLTRNAYTTENMLNLIGFNYDYGSGLIFLRSIIENDWIAIFPGLLIFVMIISLLMLAWSGLSRYRSNPLSQKWQYLVAILGGYFIIIFTTVISYGIVFDQYHSDVYAKYAFMTYADTAKIKSSDTEQMKEVTQGEYTVKACYYRIEGTDRYEYTPYRIILEKKNGDIYSIEPAVKNLYDSNELTNFETENFNKFSLATYLGGGYGEAVPVAKIIKDQVLSEQWISYIMWLVIFSLVMTILQLFFDNHIKNSIFDSKRKGILN